jgi:TRAP transporter TAXI family solute receptor
VQALEPYLQMSDADIGSERRICLKNSQLRPQNGRRENDHARWGNADVPADAAALRRLPVACGRHREGSDAPLQQGEATMRLRLGQALAFVSLAGVLACAASIEAAWAQQRKTVRAPTAAETGEVSKVLQINNWTLGLAGGLPTGTFIRFAAEIARNLNDPEEMRVLPVITQGATDNVKDLLYLRGIDIAITNADVLEHFKTTERIANIEKRINFISEMVISEVHLVVRPEINSIQDLEGKEVSLGAKGAGQSTTGPIVFKRLGVNPKFVYVDNAIALEKMRTGEIVAIVNNGAKPLDLLTKFKNDGDFKFLPIPIDRFDEYYIPATLTAQDYPAFIKPGEKIETLGVQTVLAVYNWPKESDRYRRVQRFVERSFDLFEKLHAPPYHPKWKSVNLAANVPGWTRYAVAEEKLKRTAGVKPPPAIETSLNREKVRTGSPGDSADQEKLFQQFLEWSKKQGKR